jgi:transposase
MRVHRSAGGAKRVQKQPIVCSRGGQNTKVNLVCDVQGRPRVLCLTGGDTHDVKPAIAMLRHVHPKVRVIADKACDSKELRDHLSERGIKGIIPNRSNPKRPYSFDAVTYKRRNVVERTFCRLKDFRRFATRYDQLAASFMVTACIAAIVAY